MLLAGHRQGRGGLRGTYPSGDTTPQRDTASWMQARTGSHPEERIPAGTPPERVLLAGHKQGREAPEGRIPASTAPPAGYYELDTGKGGKPPRGVSLQVQPPSGILRAGHRQGREGPREAYPIEHSTPSGYCYLDASKGGKPSRDVSQRVLLDVHFRGRVLGLQNGVVRVLCITR